MNRLGNIYAQESYNRSDKYIRELWNLCWLIFAWPFPKSSAHKWKCMLLKFWGAKINYTCIVYNSAKIYKPWNLIMDDFSTIGTNTIIYNSTTIHIGKYSTISDGSYLCTASHDISSNTNEQIDKPIIIKDRVWIASQAFIGPGVNICEGAVVGARAVVFKDVDPWTVVAGNPAKFIKKRIIKEK